MMRLFPTEDETIVGTAQAIRAGRLTCVNVVDRCLSHIDKREHEIKAWVNVDRSGATKAALVLDQELKGGHDRGPLHGIPFGIKDIIDVAGSPTGAGFGPWSHRIADTDAPLVAALRAAGAVILGKTVTTPFAWIDPPITRNPWNLDRTPGGSSSGSAAAVAAGMCLGAIGTQTGGSVIRPASFCGVVAYKPPFSVLEPYREGIVPFAASLDTPGLFARSIEDIYLTYVSLLSNLSEKWTNLKHRVSDDRRDWVLSRKHPKSIGRPVEFADSKVDAQMQGAIDHVFVDIAKEGTSVVDQEWGVNLEEIRRVHRTIMAVEGAEFHEWTLATSGEAYPPKIRAIVEEGLATRAVDYLRAFNQRSELQRAFLCESDAPRWFMTPAALGGAPDPSTTGDPCMNSSWTLLGHGAFTVPIGTDSDGLPLGAQLITSLGNDATRDPNMLRELFGEAHWLEQTIRQSLGS